MRITIDRHVLCDLILACDVFYESQDGTKWKDYGNTLREQLRAYDREREERRNAGKKR